MNTTNLTGIPEFVFRAITHSDYSRGDADFSITELIAPPQIRVLRKAHSKEIEEDVLDKVNLFIGSAVHKAIEAAANGGVEIQEKRLFAKVAGVKVSGAVDCYVPAESHIYDVKVVQSSKIKWKSYEEWESQLNCYAYLCRLHQMPVERLTIVAFIKDWSRAEAESDPRYPRHIIVQVPLSVWPEEQAKAYIRERVRVHIEAMADVSVHPCSDKDRWKNNLRCKEFCQVKSWCTQYAGIKEAMWG